LFLLNEYTYISNTHKTEGKEFDTDEHATACREPNTAALSQINYIHTIALLFPLHTILLKCDENNHPFGIE
jgi:hypothetical protein